MSIYNTDNIRINRGVQIFVCKHMCKTRQHYIVYCPERCYKIRSISAHDSLLFSPNPHGRGNDVFIAILEKVTQYMAGQLHH